METCIDCGLELNALNISDVENNMCGDCCDKKIDVILRENNVE
jgi:hypothetical protein